MARPKESANIAYVPVTYAITNGKHDEIKRGNEQSIIEIFSFFIFKRSCASFKRHYEVNKDDNKRKDHDNGICYDKCLKSCISL